MANSAGYDTIVIGGGIAGLSAAAHLAKAGKQVVLFEQHDKPGGYYTSFVRDGIIFDITAHWTVAHEQVNRMLAGLGAEPIEFVHHPNIGRYVGPGAGSVTCCANSPRPSAVEPVYQLACRWSAIRLRCRRT